MTDDETAVTPGGPLTPAALREVAGWLDTYDDLAAQYFDLLVDEGLAPQDRTERAREAVAGKGVQGDLRRWADELEAGGSDGGGPAGAWAYEDLPLAAVEAASHAAAHTMGMGALHVGSDVLLRLLNAGVVWLTTESLRGPTVRVTIEQREAAERARSEG